MGYNISALEGRNGGKDWPLIVEAVPCETCGAKEGEKCVAVGTTKINAFFTPGAERIDYHATRKQFAAHVWYSGRAEGVPEDDIVRLVAEQPSSAESGKGEEPPAVHDQEPSPPITDSSSVPSGKEEGTPTQASAPDEAPPPTSTDPAEN